MLGACFKVGLVLFHHFNIFKTIKCNKLGLGLGLEIVDRDFNKIVIS